MTDSEKKSLHTIVSSPLFRKAVEEVCDEIWSEKRSAVGLEAKAGAFDFIDGSLAAINKLFARANVAREQVPNPKRLRFP